MRRRSRLRRRSNCWRFGNWRNSSCGRLNGGLLFACCWSRGWLYGHSCRWWGNNNNRARGRSSCGSFGNNRACWRTRSDGRSGGWRSHDRSCRARLRNNLAWFRPGRRRSCRCCGNRSCGRRRGGRGNLGRRSHRRFHRATGLARIFFLLGLQSLQHIAGLGDVRKIDLGDDRLRAVAARRCPRVRGALRFPREVRAYLLSLVKLQRAGVRLAGRNADSWKNVENRSRLYFQLFREIVDTNLTHPPLFNVCRQQAVSRS
jgi:hypothetical protein